MVDQKALSPELDDAPIENRARRRRYVLAIRIAAFLVLYVLSIGPMFYSWYEAEHMGGSPLVRAFYLPLRLLCEVPGFEDMLNRYIIWWV